MEKIIWVVLKINLDPAKSRQLMFLPLINISKNIFIPNY